MKRTAICDAHVKEAGLSDGSDVVAFERLKRTLAEAFAAPDSTYVLRTADDVIARNRKS